MHLQPLQSDALDPGVRQFEPSEPAKTSDDAFYPVVTDLPAGTATQGEEGNGGWRGKRHKLKGRNHRGWSSSTAGVSEPDGAMRPHVPASSRRSQSGAAVCVKSVA